MVPFLTSTRISLFLLFFVSVYVQAQSTPDVSTTTLSVVDSSLATESYSSADFVQASLLLPNKMSAIQRTFWGANGLLRTVGVAPFTVENRRREVKIRHFMLVSHEITGYVTLAGLAIQGIVGAKLSNATGERYDQLYQAQQTMLTITNIAYGSTALLSLTAPPALTTNGKRAGGIRLHKYLATIHLAGFIATNIIARNAGKSAEMNPYRQVATFTTLAAFAPALIALKF